MYGALSTPLSFSGNFSADIDIAYDYFQQSINNRSKRPALFDKEVFIEAKEIISDRPQGFWHVISLKDSQRFQILPCVNDINIDLCNLNCDNRCHQIAIKYGTETRNICLLRASRLPWIIDIIKLANRGDSHVKVWLKPGSGKQSPKLYLRYNHDGADYVLIFSVEKHYYRLISAYPVFYTNEKKNFDKDCTEYAWSYFNT